MVNVPHMGFALVEQAQAQKEVTVNRALKDIDALLNMGIADKDLSAPPASPVAGAVYIVGAAATGAWAGKDKSLAYYDDIWRFITPGTGLRLWVNDENEPYVYSGSAWQAEGNLPRSYGKAQVATLKSLTDAATISWDVENAPMASVTLGGNRTLANPTNAKAGGVYTLIVKQGTPGSKTLSFGSAYAFPGGSAPTITTTAAAVDVLSFIYDGSAMLGVAQQNFV